MDLTKLSTADFKNIARLLQRRESLLSQVADIDQRLGSYNGFAIPARRGTTPARTASAGANRRRGALKEKIISALKSAGSGGVAVKDLSTRLKTKPANIHIWFATTGKKVANIKRVGPGRYAWVS